MTAILKSSLFLVLFLLSSVYASSPSNKGLEIALKVKKANEGFLGESSKMTMVLIDAYGAKIERIMEGKVMEVNNDGDKSISEFLNPKDVKGTKMLTWTHKEGDDDQWLFLPSLKRVKRISSSNKSGSFMGSEFSYEDLGSQEVEKYTYKFISEVKGKEWKTERYPKISSGYTKMVITTSQKYMSPTKIDYYDRKNELLKTAEFSNWKEFSVKGKKIWRANKIHMKNVQTKKQSIFEWSERKLGVSMKDKDFRKTALK